jgi:hypothetical protein
VGPLSQNFDVLDLGFCEPSCNCTSDCRIPGRVCQAFATDANSAQLKADLGSNGLCTTAVGGTELTCGEGGAGGVSNTGGDTAGAAGN